jgi:SPP1 family predicted phage head-tail adaptor
MRAGTLNENITILRAEKVRDDYGIDKEEWKEFASTKAAVKYLSGSRTVDVQELFFDERVEFTIRYYHQVSPTDRIKYYGQMYRIISINPDKRANSQTIVTEIINE